MATERRKLLMQNAKDPARWEALQIIGEGPQDFVRTELDTRGAEAYQKGGGFSIVPPREYNDELGRISERVRGARAPAPMPASEPAWEMPRNAAESVALLNQQGGYEGRGAAAASGLADDEAALSGRSMVEKPMSMDPELERRIARERARDAEGSARSRAIAAERTRDTGGRRAGAAVPGTGGNQPTVSVGKPGEAGTLRMPTPLRPPSGRPPAASEAEGVATREAPAGDEEFAAAQAAGDERALAIALSRAGARASEAISGVRGDSEAYDALEKTTGNPVRDLLARRDADKRKSLEDPTSEQSQRLQAYVAKALPGVYSPEELQGITAADADTVTRYGEMRQRLDQRAADRSASQEQRAADIAREDAQRLDDRTWQAKQAAAGRTFTAGENAKNRAANLAEAQVRAGGVNGQAKGTTIPGLEVTPGAAPTPDDAKRVKGAVAAKERLQALTGELRGLHQKYGTELAGANAQRMAQLTTAIQLEAKTLAELGALTGPDLELIQRITGEDPSSLKANLKSLVGLDNTQETLEGVDQWGRSLADATKKTYGYRDAPQAAQPAQKTVVDRIRMPDGKTVTLYSDGTEEVS